jgi:hypothetical protein
VNYPNRKLKNLSYSSYKRKYSRINLTKKVKSVYTKSDKTLMKEIEETLSKWKDIPCSWIGKINTKMSLLSKVTYRFIISTSNISMTLITNQKKI